MIKRLTALARQVLQPRYITLHGVKLDLQCPAISKELREFIYSGKYESQEMKILKSTFNAEDVLLDIGAGLGLTAIWAAKKATGPDQVYAVEASPMLIDAITANTKLNDIGLSLKWSAVSVDTGQVTFYLAPHFWSSSLLPRDDGQVINVPAVSLDSLLSDIRPSYLMMDIEGAEFDLLINSTLPDIDKLCVEIHAHYIGMEKATDLVAHLFDIGFKAERSLCAENGHYFYRP